MLIVLVVAPVMQRVTQRVPPGPYIGVLVVILNNCRNPLFYCSGVHIFHGFILPSFSVPMGPDLRVKNCGFFSFHYCFKLIELYPRSWRKANLFFFSSTIIHYDHVCKYENKSSNIIIFYETNGLLCY